ncbi:hypothetical protein BKA80DRAFT_45347 [Phyllosticta citrichinensis]
MPQFLRWYSRAAQMPYVSPGIDLLVTGAADAVFSFCFVLIFFPRSSYFSYSSVPRERASAPSVAHISPFFLSFFLSSILYFREASSFLLTFFPRPPFSLFSPSRSPSPPCCIFEG